ncbi:MAG: protein-glutamate O-methyltransferase CheR [Clostridiales Family XIII bacterium]|jgi:chemotaxis protein methyltransferase CheR|nr:protein-glutamate O-methyltransferase CheR [Clostridiales Family XIII bacterium]
MIPLDDVEFKELTRFLQEGYGIDLTKKRLLVQERLGRYVKSLGFTGFSDYFRYVQQERGGHELSKMIGRLTTNHTYFMREEGHFGIYESAVLPWIVQELGDTDLRVWSAGCASGPEPYTLSMITLDYFYPREGHSGTCILATDISEETLFRASRGVYKADELTALPEQWRQRYFTPTEDKKLQITQALRKNVAFKCLNLLDDFEVKKPFHAIFCRNVMIYFDNGTRETVVQKLYDALRPGGWLFIGQSETLSNLRHGFHYVCPSVYRKGSR